MHDANAQNSVDMDNARKAGTIDTTQLTKFIHSKLFIHYFLSLLRRVRKMDRTLGLVVKRFEIYSPMILRLIRLRGSRSVLQAASVLNGPCRDFMSRTERFLRGQRLTNRLFELEKIHGWSRTDLNLAASLLDDALPFTLHTVGSYSPPPHLPTLTPAQRLSPSSLLKRPPSSWMNMLL